MHNPGVLEFFMGYDENCYRVKSARTANAARRPEHVFQATVGTLGLLASPVLLYITWRKQLAALQQVKDTKGGPAVMWACIAWISLANLYMAVKGVSVILTSRFTITIKVQKENAAWFSLIVVYSTIIFLIAAVVQSGKALPGLPYCSVLKRATVRRMVKFYVWCNFNILVALILAKSPYVVLLVGTNPFLYGSALLAIVFAASLPILLTATLFSIGQVFLEDPDFRLTWREAVRQAGWLLLVGTGCVGVALFLGCICFLLLLSKDGNKVQSVSGVASFLMRHVVLTSLPLLMNSLIRFIKNIRI